MHSLELRPSGRLCSSASDASTMSPRFNATAARAPSPPPFTAVGLGGGSTAPKITGIGSAVVELGGGGSAAPETASGGSVLFKPAGGGSVPPDLIATTIVVAIAAAVYIVVAEEEIEGGEGRR